MIARFQYELMTFLYSFVGLAAIPFYCLISKGDHSLRDRMFSAFNAIRFYPFLALSTAVLGIAVCLIWRSYELSAGSYGTTLLDAGMGLIFLSISMGITLFLRFKSLPDGLQLRNDGRGRASIHIKNAPSGHAEVFAVFRSIRNQLLNLRPTLKSLGIQKIEFMSPLLITEGEPDTRRIESFARQITKALPGAIAETLPARELDIGNSYLLRKNYENIRNKFPVEKFGLNIPMAGFEITL